MKPKSYLIFICAVATMGGLMFGFDLAIISGAIPFIQSYFGWNEIQLGWGVSSLLVGAVLGAMVSGPLSDKFGRKKIMIVVALFFALSCLGTALSQSASLFIYMRLLGGLSVGAVSVLAPMYVAELAPASKRGQLVSVYQLSITIGILLSYLINYSLHDVEGNWRLMFATGIVPSILYFIGLFWIPESPRWLYIHGQRQRAIKVLNSICESEAAQVEAAQIESSMNGEKSVKVSIAELFKPGVRKSILVGFLLAIFVQMCGINTIIDYAPKILLAAGVEIKNALLQTSLIGIINFASTFFAIWLIEKVGRRKLYIIGSISMTVSMLMLSGSFFLQFSPIITLSCLLLFIASFAAFIGPVFWTVVSEMFPNRVRGTAVAFASFTQWVVNFVVILFFPHLFANWGGAVSFLFFAGMCLLQLLIVCVMLPETSGKSLEEIEKLWIKPRREVKNNL